MTEESKQRGWGLLAGLMLAAAALAVLWWLMQQREEDAPEHAVRLASRAATPPHIPLPAIPAIEIPLDDPVELPPPAPVEAAAPAADDLKLIDGIGPKYAQTLQALGVMTFSQLAAQDPDDLAARLQAEGVRIIGDSVRQKDWIGQAARLAAGEFEA